MQRVFYAKTRKHERGSKYKGCEFCPISTYLGENGDSSFLRLFLWTSYVPECSEDIGRHPQVWAQFLPYLKQGLLFNAAYSGLAGTLPPLSWESCDYRHCSSTWLTMGAKNPNIDPHACIANVLPTEPAPHPRISSMKGCFTN